MLYLYGLEEFGEKVLDLYYPHEIHEIAHFERWYKRDELTGDYSLDKNEINDTLARMEIEYRVSSIHVAPHFTEIICSPV